MAKFGEGASSSSQWEVLLNSVLVAPTVFIFLNVMHQKLQFYGVIGNRHAHCHTYTKADCGVFACLALEPDLLVDGIFGKIKMVSATMASEVTGGHSLHITTVMSS